jgi:sec-independent protein translocase protein TatA
MLSGSFSLWHCLIVLALVITVFGTRKLRTAGGDLGAAVRNFKSALREGEAQGRQLPAAPPEAAGRPDRMA